MQLNILGPNLGPLILHSLKRNSLSHGCGLQALWSTHIDKCLSGTSPITRAEADKIPSEIPSEEAVPMQEERAPSYEIPIGNLFSTFISSRFTLTFNGLGGRCT